MPRDGWQVFATVRSAGRAISATASSSLIADVTDEASLDAAAAAALPDAIDLLILNAGINAGRAGCQTSIAAKWAEVMAVNALGPLLAARAFGGQG